MKSPFQHFYQKCSLILVTWNWKTSLLVRSEVLGLFGNILTADPMYSRHYLREISAIFSSAIISRPKNIFKFFITFSESRQNFPFFEKKHQLHSLKISNILNSKKSGY